ncbi:MAG: L-2-amino-thiazoline-4-carboxylic acid hydrolase [Candidatus Bathyarchaeota archaeon]|nr:L-2-amino-thiazoline-4-carboxylic acid hydrolase [Candidatus Bathyarchaeota archaeon]
MKDSGFEYEQVRKWIQEKEYGRATGIYYMAQGILQELGEEQGTKLILQQIRKMGNQMGASIRKRLEEQGLDNSLENRVKVIESSDNSTNIAWDQVSLDVMEDEFVVKFSYCPIAAGFKQHGEDGVKIGELFCSNIDDAVSQGYNPKLSCVRESSLNRDGVCTLHFKMCK